MPVASSSSGPLSDCNKGQERKKPICYVSARQACQISMMSGQQLKWQNTLWGNKEEKQLPSEATEDGLEVKSGRQRKLQWLCPGLRQLDEEEELTC